MSLCLKFVECSTLESEYVKLTDLYHLLVETLLSCKWNENAKNGNGIQSAAATMFNADGILVISMHFEKLKWTRQTFSNHSRFSIDEISFRSEINVALKELCKRKKNYNNNKRLTRWIAVIAKFSLCKNAFAQRKKNANTNWRKMYSLRRTSLSVKSFTNYFDETKFFS